jgi:hypothetical protein
VPPDGVSSLSDKEECLPCTTVLVSRPRGQGRKKRLGEISKPYGVKKGRPHKGDIVSPLCEIGIDIDVAPTGCGSWKRKRYFLPVLHLRGSPIRQKNERRERCPDMAQPPRQRLPFR